MSRLLSNLYLHARGMQILNTASVSRLRAPRLLPAVQHLTTKESQIHRDGDLTDGQEGGGDTNEKWRKIYHLPVVHLVSAFNRLKIYQALVTAAGTPLVYALEQAGHLSENATSVFASIGGTGLLTLSLASLVVQQLVGIVYINNVGDQIKLAYVDFWGRRRDAFVDVVDLMADSEQPKPSWVHFYQTIRLHSDAKRHYKLHQRYGIVLDPATFSRLFGECPF